VELGIETLPTRRLLYQLAEMEGDQAAAERQLAWARGRPRGFDLIGAHAQVAAFRGEMFQARRLFEQTIEEADGSRLTQIAAGYAAQLALTDAMYGYPALAAARARRIRPDTSYEPQLRAAAALAVAGVPGDAERWIDRIRGVRPSDTLLHTAYLPVAEAAARLARDRADATLEALRPAAPYERGTIAALLPIYFRGEARRRTKAFGEAAREFRAVIANRGADPFSAAIPLAYLGLARSLAAAGDTEGSRRAYGDLFEIWKNADTDLPALTQARAEAAALGG
jgi:hypothetical protein